MADTDLSVGTTAGQQGGQIPQINLPGLLVQLVDSIRRIFDARYSLDETRVITGVHRVMKPPHHRLPARD